MAAKFNLQSGRYIWKKETTSRFLYDQMTEIKLYSCVLALACALSEHSPVLLPLLLLTLSAGYLLSAAFFITLSLTALFFILTIPAGLQYQPVLFFAAFLGLLLQLFRESNTIFLNTQLRTLGYLLKQKRPTMTIKVRSRWQYELQEEGSRYILSITSGEEQGGLIRWETPAMERKTEDTLIWICNTTEKTRQLNENGKLLFYGNAENTVDFLLTHWEAKKEERQWQEIIKSEFEKNHILVREKNNLLIPEGKHNCIYPTTKTMLNYLSAQQLLENSDENSIVVWLQGRQNEWNAEGLHFVSGEANELIEQSLRSFAEQPHTTVSYRAQEKDLWAYQTLELGLQATPEEVRISFQKLIKKYHPDKTRQYSSEDNEKYRDVIAAYQHLKNQFPR